MDIPVTSEPSESELRALYDIRVKEAHHYNTVIWAFPSAYIALIAAEVRLLDQGSIELLCASIFNIALCYVFVCHLENKASIQKALLFIEEKIGARYGGSFIPTFTDSRPKATSVMKWSVIVLTALFLARVLLPMLPSCCAVKIQG